MRMLLPACPPGAVRTGVLSPSEAPYDAAAKPTSPTTARS